MSPIALVSAISLLAGVTALTLLALGWKRIASGTLRHTLAVLGALLAFNGCSNLLQWSELTDVFDRFEDFVQLLIPLMWGMAVYELLRNREEQALKETAEELRQERDLVQSITRTSPAGIVLLNADGTILFTNPRAEELFGRSSEQLLGCKCDPLEWGITDAEGNPISADNLPDRQVARLGKSMYNERCTVLQPSGERVHLAVNAVPFSGAGEAEQGVLVTLEDITQGVIANQALQDSERKLRGIIDQSTDMVVLTDETGAIIEWNASAETATGLRREEVVQRPIWEVQWELATPEENEKVDRDLIRGLIQEALATGQGNWLGKMSDSIIQRRDGTQRALQSIEFVIQTGQGYRLGSVLRDVTDYQQARAALLQSERNYREIFNAASDAIFIHDAQSGMILDANQAALDLFGYSYGEALRLRLVDILTGGENRAGKAAQMVGDYPGSEDLRKAETQVTPEAVEQALPEALQDEAQRVEMLVRRREGTAFWVEAAVSQVELGGQRRVLSAVRDISERKQAEKALFEEKERAQVTLHSIGDAVITTDALARVQYLNPVAEALTGWTLAEASGRPLAKIFRVVDEQTRQPAPNPVRRCLQEGKVGGLANHSVLISRSGREYDIDDTAAPILGVDGQLLGVVLVFHDVTEARRLERRMAHDAAHDTLTGLVNRREFEVRIERALTSAQERNAEHVLCYMDLDHFKIINDSEGHAAGDELLKQVANLLSGLFRQRDTLARLGGDEFGLLLENCPLERGVNIANEVIALVSHLPFNWQGRGYKIGVSIGIAPIEATTETFAQVLSQADVACYTAKELGRGRVHVYQWQQHESAQRQSEILRAAHLREALEWEQFQLYCQPIVPLQSNGDPALCEVLLRLLDEEGQLILPAVFFPSAERFGLMGNIDRWVIQATLKHYAATFGHSQGPVATINLSAYSLNDEALLDYVYQQFRQNNLQPECVCFEITEAAAIHNLTRVQRFASELRRMGGRIALDNFGSGFSSFRYLKNLPVDYLKIEGSFVREMLTNASDRVMVAAINQVGHTLGIQTIAEHVSEAGIVEQLRWLGVDYAQGFGLGPPRPLEEAWGGKDST